MSVLKQIQLPAEYDTRDVSSLPPFDSQLLVQHAADAHWIVSDSTGRVTAHASLWWKNVPAHPLHQLGLVGHFAAADRKPAGELLSHATSELARHGCTLAVGPMDGSTWRRYRLLTERGSEPSFFLEPDNPDEWPHWFRACGFSPLAIYFSSLTSDLLTEDSRIPRTVARLQQQGVHWRPLNLDRFLDELRHIYAVSRVSFQTNFLYTPITEAEFLAQYERIRAHVRPELVLLAKHEGQPVGFVFAIPDLARAKRGAIDTVILKTVAVLPGRAYAGLGNVLVAQCHNAARRLGFRRAIHALMHETNNSLNLSAHYAKPFRRYTLFAREINSAPQ